MVQLFTLNPASFASSAQLGSTLQTVPLETLTPDLAALGGALVMERIEGAEYLAYNSDAAAVIRQIGGMALILPPERWRAVRKTWQKIEEDILHASPQALQRRASLFSKTPSEAIRRFLMHPEPSVASHPLAGIVRINGEKISPRILLMVQVNAEENRVGGLVSKGKRLEIYLKSQGGREANEALQKYLAQILGLSKPEEVIITTGREHSKRKSIFVPSVPISWILDSLNNLGPRLTTLHEAAIVEKEIHDLWQYFSRYYERKEELEVRLRDYGTVLPRLRILGRYVHAESGGLSILDRRVAELSERLDKNFKLILNAFGLKVALDKETKEEIIVDEFGEKYDLDELPGIIPADFKYLGVLSAKVQEAYQGAKKNFEEALRGIQEGWHLGRVDALVLQGTSRIKAILGDLTLTEEKLHIVHKGPGKRKRSFFEQWNETSRRLQEAVEREFPKPFFVSEELKASLREFNEKLQSLRISGKNIRGVVKTLKLSVPRDKWTPEMAALYGIIKKAMKTLRTCLDEFAKVYATLFSGTELSPNLSEREQRRLLREARYLKIKAGTALGTAERALRGTGHNLTYLIQHRGERKGEREYAVPDRIDTVKVKIAPGETIEKNIQVKGGYAEIDDARISLKGTLKAQYRTLQRIVSLLAIPKNEMDQSVSLAFHLFKEEVEQRIRMGKPLRVLKDIDTYFGVAIVYDYRFGTTFYVPYNASWLMKEAKAIVLMFHGAGGARSTGKTMAGPMIRLRNAYRYNAITFDTPNHGLAFKDERFHNLSEFIGWAKALIDYFRFLSGGKIPLIGVGRSHGDNTLDELETRFPETLDGTVHISGYDPAWSKANEKFLNERIRAGDFKPNRLGLPMAMAHEGLGVTIDENGHVTFYDQGEDQWTFLKPEADLKHRMIDEKGEPTGNTPSLYAQGDHDPEYVNGVPDYWRKREEFAKRRGQKVLTIKGGGHDLLAITPDPSEKKRIDIVYGAIHDFIEEVCHNFYP